MGIPSKLKELVSKVHENSQFNNRHGHLLNLVIYGFEEGVMRVLFQFFDPKHHCFTFPNYQLVPTMEEFSKLLGVPILDQIPFIGLEKDPRLEDITATLHLKPSDIAFNWETKSGVKGLLEKFLMEKAQLFLDSMSFHDF